MSMTELTVMTYNICHFNFDQGGRGFPKEVMNEKVNNLKEMFMEYHPDIIGIQEDAQYIDLDHTIKSPDYLYAPIWTFRSGYKACTIRSKLPYVGGHKLFYTSDGMGHRKGVFRVDGKRLLFLSCHPIAHVGNSEKRLQAYKEIFETVKSVKWDWCVITGDFNTTEKVDKENLRKLCDANNFDMLYGGSYLPWINTYPGHKGTSKQSFDNVLISKGITFKSVKVLRNWYDKLYSDHVPIVADIILE